MKQLEVKNLDITFHSVNGDVHAVRGVSFDLDKGETLAIVGESGCGKSVTAKAILRLLDRTNARISKDAEIWYGGRNLLKLKEKEMNRIRGNGISMVFQDSSMSLNPVMKIGKHFTELFQDHAQMSKKEASKKAISLLEKVKLPDPEQMLERYPHELSGGQKQRVMIALAIALHPVILIADEPTTALDVTVQAQILRLLKDLQRELGMSILLITHDLGIVGGFADRVQVMYGGEILERGTTENIYHDPRHPYTAALLSAVPQKGMEQGTELFAIPGTPPDLRLAWKGCPYAPRCRYAMGICRRQAPKPKDVTQTGVPANVKTSAPADRSIPAHGLPDTPHPRHEVTCWLTDPRAPEISLLQQER